MKRLFLALCTVAVLASCGTQSVPPTQPAGHNGPAGPPVLGGLPGLAELGAIRSASALFSGLTILTAKNATVVGGVLNINPPAGEFGYIIFDLGTQPADFTIGSIDFPNANWTSLSPAPKVFVGVSDYTTTRWDFRQRPAAGGAADFNGLPPATSLLSPTNHSYVAVVTDATNLDFGDTIDIQSNSGPSGDLPAKWTVTFPGLPAISGQANAIAVKADNSGGDIATYCPNPLQGIDGGAWIHFDYDAGTDSLVQTVHTLFDSGEALFTCHAYRMDYYPDGRLAIGAARRGPISIREIRENTPGSGTFSIQTAVDNTFLPAVFDDPQYDYAIDDQGDPHVLFLANTGVLGYAYNISGSYGIDTGGPTVAGAISMVLSGQDIVCCYRKAGAASGTQLAVRRFQQVPPNDFAGPDYGTEGIAFTDPTDDGALDTALELGLGGSIHVAHRLHDAASNSDQLGFAYRDDGVVSSAFTDTVADPGTVSPDLTGNNPSIGILHDGTPVIAYYDATTKSLRFAISSVPDAGNITGNTWATYDLDVSRFNNEVGHTPALGVIQRTAPDPDKIVVAYGVVTGGDSVLRTVLFDAPAH